MGVASRALYVLTTCMCYNKMMYFYQPMVQPVFHVGLTFFLREFSEQDLMLSLVQH